MYKFIHALEPRFLFHNDTWISDQHAIIIAVNQRAYDVLNKRADYLSGSAQVYLAYNQGTAVVQTAQFTLRSDMARHADQSTIYNDRIAVTQAVNARAADTVDARIARTQRQAADAQRILLDTGVIDVAIAQLVADLESGVAK